MIIRFFFKFKSFIFAIKIPISTIIQRKKRLWLSREYYEQLNKYDILLKYSHFDMAFDESDTIKCFGLNWCDAWGYELATVCINVD